MGEQNGKDNEPITHVDIPVSEGTDGANNESESSAAVEKPTLSALADSGLTLGEIEIAKAQGLVKGDDDGGDKGERGNGDTNKSGVVPPADGSTKKEGNTNGKKEKETEERHRVLTKGKSPEQIIAEVGAAGELSQEQEKALLANLTQNGQAMYWTQKKERKARQKVEAESGEKLALKDKEIEELKAKLADVSKDKRTDEDPLDIDSEQPAEEIEPDSKPLTKADLDKIEAEKKAKAEKESVAFEERKREVTEALNFQQSDAAERYGKDEVESSLSFVHEILSKANEGKLEDLYPEPRQRSKIFRKVTDLLRAYATADRFESGEFNAADMSIDLAKEHPKYKPATKNSKSNTNGNKSGETDADGNPEDVDRALKNANRRGSSATLNGGSSRRVVLEELTPEQAVRIPMKNWNKLPKEHRDRLLQE